MVENPGKWREGPQQITRLVQDGPPQLMVENPGKRQEGPQQITRLVQDGPLQLNQSINHGGLSRAARLARQSSWLVIQTSSSNLSSVPKSLFRVSMKVALGRPCPLRP